MAEQVTVFWQNIRKVAATLLGDEHYIMSLDNATFQTQAGRVSA